MTPNVITRTMAIAKRMLEDSRWKEGDGDKRFRADRGRRKKPRFGTGSSYVITVIKQATPTKGMICRKCDLFIRLGERCYSKQGNNDCSIRAYYHIECAEKLYQE